MQMLTEEVDRSVMFEHLAVDAAGVAGADGALVRMERL